MRRIPPAQGGDNIGDLPNDIDKELVVRDTTDWINARVAAAQPSLKRWV